MHSTVLNISPGVELLLMLAGFLVAYFGLVALLVPSAFSGLRKTKKMSYYSSSVRRASDDDAVQAAVVATVIATTVVVDASSTISH